MALNIKPLAENAGLEVSGINLDMPLDADTQKALQDAFMLAGILLFRCAATGPEAHLSLSRCFGQLQRHPVRENWADGYPELVDISYRPLLEGDSTVALYEVDGKRRGGWLPWHSDLRYMSKINRGEILRSIKLPREGGQTGFVDQIAAYAMLPERLRQRIDRLHVVYQLRSDFTQEKFGKPKSLKMIANAAARVRWRAASIGIFRLWFIRWFMFNRKPAARFSTCRRPRPSASMRCRTAQAMRCWRRCCPTQSTPR
jgi:taurine dioxygenase